MNQRSRFRVQAPTDPNKLNAESLEVFKPTDPLPPSRLLTSNIPGGVPNSAQSQVGVSRFTPAAKRTENLSTFYPNFPEVPPVSKVPLDPPAKPEQREFNSQFVDMPPSRLHMQGGRPSERPFGQQQRMERADDDYVPEEFDDGDSGVRASVMNASVHSMKSEQSFKKNRLARESVAKKEDPQINLVVPPDLEKAEGPFVPIADQPTELLDPLVVRNNQTDPQGNLQRNLYRISPFVNVQDGAYTNLGSALLLAPGKEIEMPDELNDIWDPEQFQPIGAQQLKNNIFVTVKAHKVKLPKQIENQRDSDVMAFKSPPVLMPYLTNSLDYNEELKMLQAVAEPAFDMDNERFMEHKLRKFKLQMQSMLSRVKTKLACAEKIAEYIQSEWPYLADRYETHQVKHSELVTRIFEFVQHAGLEEFLQKHYLTVAAETESQSKDEQSFLRRVNQAFNFCLSTKSLPKDPQIVHMDDGLEVLLREMNDMSQMVNKEYFQGIVENPSRLQTYFLWVHERGNYVPVFEADKEVITQCSKLPDLYGFLFGVGERLLEQVCLFTSFLATIRVTLTEQTHLFVSLASNFLTQCQEFEHLFGFRKQCEKLILILQQGLSQLQAIKIPMCTEKYHNFNMQLIDNANLKFLRAEQKLNKYLRKTIMTFPEELREDVMDERRRKDVVKHQRKNQDAEVKDIKGMLSEPLMLAQRVECFTVCLKVRDEYLMHIEDCKKVKDVFMTLPQVEVDVYKYQGERDTLKEFFMKTENREIVAYQLVQVQALKQKLQSIYQDIQSKKWDAFNFKQVAINYHLIEQNQFSVSRGLSHHQSDVDVSFHDDSLPSCVPHQIQRLLQWITAELQAVDNLEQLHQQYIEGYSESKQLLYDKALWRQQSLVERIQDVIKFEPTVDEIISGALVGTQEYHDVLRFVFETTIQPDEDERDRLDYSRIQPTLQLDLDLEQHLDYLTQQKVEQSYSTALRGKFLGLYDELSLAYQNYTIWQNVQSCRFLMDGEVLSNIIKSTTLFPVLDEPPLPMSLLTLQKAQEVMRRLMRAFNLNIKNSEHCVFFKIYLQEGLKVVSIVLAHFAALKGLLKLNYNEKKQVKIDDISANVMKEVLLLFDDPQFSLNIIRDPLISGIRYFLDQNIVQFRTKGATLDWDKQIDETRSYILEVDQTLLTASQFLEQIIRSTLLKHYQPPKLNQSKINVEATKVVFGPEEFYMGSQQLLRVQQSKLRIGKVRIECENLINNQVDQQEYKFRFRYLIQVIDEVLLWVKAIEKIARVAYMTMGKIKDVLEFDDSLTQDYLRQMRLFSEEININIKDIKAIEMRSPFSFKGNVVQSDWKPSEEFRVELQCASPIDSQLLLIHKIAKMTVHLIDILQRCVSCLLNFATLTELEIQIDEDFFDLLDRFVVFYKGVPKNSKKKVDELAEPVFDKQAADIDFQNSILEIPDYCPFPKQCLSDCMKSFEPIIEVFQARFDMKSIMQMNTVIQTYMEASEAPILSLTTFVSDLTQLLKIETRGKKQLSRSTLVNFANLCTHSEIDFEDFLAMINKLLNMANQPQIKNQECLNKLKDQDLWRQFLEQEQQDWITFMKLVPKMTVSYYQDIDKRLSLPYNSYMNTFQINLKTLQGRCLELGPVKNANYTLLVQLYTDFTAQFDIDFQMNSK